MQLMSGKELKNKQRSLKMNFSNFTFFFCTASLLLSKGCMLGFFLEVIMAEPPFWQLGSYRCEF